jgi:hypothetical protein
VDFAAALEVLRAAGRHEESARPEPLPGTRVGNYEVVGRPLGRGGSGYVYPARHGESGGHFALKLARAGLQDAERIFREERHKARLLNHPNILAAHDGGTHEGRPFLVFRKLEGHLTDELRRERYAEEHAALELMQKLVGAVRFAHGRFIVHCDLKPENILFDGDHEPHVADFGLARTLEASESSGEAWGGTCGWMSPEQVEKGTLGAESDVFSLGVILYWLLYDGRLPFGRGADFRLRVREEEPAPPAAKSRWASALAWDLATICQKALRKLPSDRYQSPAELAIDLERAADGRFPAGAGSVSYLRRAVRWSRRHPALALASLTALGLPPYAFSIQNDALREVRAALRPQLRFSAEAQARAVVSELFGMSLRVDAMAKDPAVVALLEHPGIGREAPALAAHAAGFDSVNVFTADGAHHARWPAAPDAPMTNLQDTDHFRCAERLAQELPGPLRLQTEAALPVCVARAHRSALDGRVKLGLSAPLLVDGRLVGVVEASTMARDHFGALRMNCGSGDCFTALLGPRDRDAPEQPLPVALSILAQRGVPIGSEMRMPVELSREICKKVGCAPDPRHPFQSGEAEPFEIDPYVDRVSGARNLAVVAPVGRTGLSVLVATPYSATQAKLAGIARAGLSGSWVPLLLGVGAWLLLFFAPNPRWPWRAQAGREVSRASGRAQRTT